MQLFGGSDCVKVFMHTDLMAAQKWWYIMGSRFGKCPYCVLYFLNHPKITSFISTIAYLLAIVEYPGPVL